MSRGPGKIEQAIGEAFKSEPERTFGTDDLIAIAFPDINHVEKKHRVSVLRAARGACRWTGFVPFNRWLGVPGEFMRRDLAEAADARRMAVAEANFKRMLGSRLPQNLRSLLSAIDEEAQEA
jgi:hypothetical protein